MAKSITLNSLIGKYVHLVRSEDYPAFLFNVQEVREHKNYVELISEQVLDSPNSDDLEVYCGPEYEIDLENVKVAGIYDTAEELFEKVTEFLKEQIERCSGLVIK
jgi:hypothetical protein